jgi:hypothetical protein|tara:strand:- start:31912 stop:32085 length:174 start_codon:yes stop_codon:yes gene_type:complete
MAHTPRKRGKKWQEGVRPSLDEFLTREKVGRGLIPLRQLIPIEATVEGKVVEIGSIS